MKKWCAYGAQGQLSCTSDACKVFTTKTRSKTENFEASPRVAVLLRGHVERRKWGRLVSWKATAGSIMQHIIEDLRKSYTVDVYISTYPSSELPSAKTYFQPCGVVVTANDGGFSQRVSFVDGLRAIVASGKTYAFVVALRFDLAIKRPMSTWMYDGEKVNFLWKETQYWWERHRRVGDPIHVFNSAYMTEFIHALQGSTPPPHTDFHWMYDSVARSVGEHNINLIIKDGFFDSNTDNMDNDIFKINRGTST